VDGPIRVLHAVVNMNRGGAETLLMNLYRNLNRAEVQFDFLTSRPGVFDEEIAAMGGVVHRIPYVTDLGHRAYVRELRRFFERHSQYRIVHAHMDKMSGAVLAAAKKSGVPVRIAHSHNTMSEGGVAARLYKWAVGRQISSSATERVACSRAAARWLFGSRAAEAAIMRNGIEGGRFAFDPLVREQVRRELGIAETTFVVGHVGRFLRQKNHAYLIERFAELQAQVADSALVLAGDGPLRPDIERKARELGLGDKVRFLGVRGDVDRLMQSFDAFVFPSFHEGLPVTLVEAQAAGLPCIVSDAVTEEADLGLGLVAFFPLKSPAEWVRRMKAAAERRSDRTIPADGLGRRGYDIAETARWAEQYYRARTR